MEETKYCKYTYKDPDIWYPVEVIHYDTYQVTVRERYNVWNTVDLDDVIFKED